MLDVYLYAKKASRGLYTTGVQKSSQIRRNIVRIAILKGMAKSKKVGNCISSTQERFNAMKQIMGPFSKGFFGQL